MGDRVAVLRAGELQQADTPPRLLDRPGNLFVAGFVGAPRMNLLEAVARDGHARIGRYVVPVGPIVRARMRGPVTIHVATEAHRVHVFDTASGERLSP